MLLLRNNFAYFLYVFSIDVFAIESFEIAGEDVEDGLSIGSVFHQLVDSSIAFILWAYIRKNIIDEIRLCILLKVFLFNNPWTVLSLINLLIIANNLLLVKILFRLYLHFYYRIFNHAILIPSICRPLSNNLVFDGEIKILNAKARCRVREEYIVDGMGQFIEMLIGKAEGAEVEGGLLWRAKIRYAVRGCH